jgi:ABC-2 type transport system ATP-binding protein
MSQRFSLYDELTVEENINFFSGVYSVPRRLRRERKEEILELLQLQERRKTTTGLLPGGWKQRLALGCAILHRPPVLFLDEPTSGVDPIARRGFWELIYRLSGEGHTIFVTTHYMDEAEYCHRLALMHAGRMIALGSPQQLRRDFPAGLLQLDVPDILQALQALENEPSVQDAAVFGKGLHLLVADPDRDASRIRATLQREGIEVQRLDAIGASMEDVFVTLIERRGQG